jgi:hypothetical protein
MKKITLTILIVVLGLVLLVFLAKLFSPGSYSNAEQYEFNISESDLILLINDFKNENPRYQVPRQVGLLDGRSNKADHWYHVYFYYPQENQIIYIWTRPSGTQKTTLAFVSINDGLVLGNWKDINKNLSSDENADQKAKFENRILNKIKQKIR